MKKARLGPIVAMAVLTILLVAMAVGLRSTQAESRRLLQSRFDARTAQAARFVTTYTQDLLTREAATAAGHLGTGDAAGDVEEFAHITDAFGFPAAVLLDGIGRVLAVTPAKPELVGQEIASTYPHLQAAVEGKATISNVVPSAAEGVPVVAFATPFATASGTYVFSGAYPVAETPIAAFLRDMSSVPGYRIYLVDTNGTVAASFPPGPTALQTLADREAALARATLEGPHGSYESDVDRYFSRSAVVKTPWRVVATVPKAGLYASVQGPGQWVPWVLLIVLGLLAYFAVFAALRYVAGRRELAVQSTTDPLTGVGNRRSAEHWLSAFEQRGARNGRPWSLLLVDLDHFKQVNDTYGHNAGDRVLQVMAERMQASLRLGDEVGRWGGEEFVVLLQDADQESALVVAERLRVACARPIELDDVGTSLVVTISIGCVTARAETEPGALIGAADAALYEAKAGGRDRVVVGGSDLLAILP